MTGGVNVERGLAWCREAIYHRARPAAGKGKRAARQAVALACPLAGEHRARWAKKVSVMQRVHDRNASGRSGEPHIDGKPSKNMRVDDVGMPLVINLSDSGPHDRITGIADVPSNLCSRGLFLAITAPVHVLLGNIRDLMVVDRAAPFFADGARGDDANVVAGFDQRGCEKTNRLLGAVLRVGEIVCSKKQRAH